MLQYLLQVIIFQLVFLLVYELFLKKETFFTANRWYLLVTPLMAMVLPFLQIPYLAELFPQEVLPIAKQNLMMPEVFIATHQPALEQAPTVNIPTEKSLHINWWLVAYIFGCVLSLSLFLKRWRVIGKLFQFKAEDKKDFRIVEIPNSRMAFTFLKTIFLGSDISVEEREQILAHELIHVSQKHSLDLLFFEVLKVVFWFNPFVYIFQHRIAALHEFIADEAVVKRTSKKYYFNQLLNSAFNTQNLSTNQFFNQSLIKKRIVMLQKRKSGQLSKLKFLLLIPAIAMMLCYVSCSNENGENENAEVNLEQYTYVVKKGEAENRTAESLVIQKKSEEFLKENNEDYVLWSSIDYTNGSVTYTVHSKDETVPQDYSSHKVSKYGDVAYTMYMNLKTQPDEEMEPAYNSLHEVLITDGTPYEKVSFPPVFGSCTSITDKEQRKACTEENIANYVLRNFNTNLGKELGLEGLTRILVQFKISADGAITEVRARAPQPELEKEAIKIVKSMPMLIPSENEPTPLTSIYTLPITFKVQA